MKKTFSIINILIIITILLSFGFYIISTHITLSQTLFVFINVLLVILIFFKLLELKSIKYTDTNYRNDFKNKELKYVALIGISFILIIYLIFLFFPSIFSQYDINYLLTFRLDTNHYIEIAKKGYENSTEDIGLFIVFFPLYPFLIWLLDLFNKPLITGLFISTFFTFLSIIYFYKLCRLDYSIKTSLNSLKFFLLMPGSFFLIIPMTESLFIFLSLLFVYLIRKRLVWQSFVVGILVGLCRSTALPLVLLAFVEIIIYFNKNKSIKNLKLFIPLFSIPIALIIYLFINYYVYGNPFKFMEIQKNHWAQGLSAFYKTTSYLISYAENWATNDYHTYLAISIPNLITIFFILITTFVGLKKIRVSYIYFILIYYFFAYGTDWLLSGVRYALPIFPLYMILGNTKNKTNNYGLTVLFIFLWLYYFHLYILGFPIH